MRVLSLSLDAHMLDTESVVATRTRAYGEVVSAYTVLVPAAASKQVTLSPTVHVYGVHGFLKLGTFLKLFSRAEELFCAFRYDIITTQDAYFLGLLGVLLSRKHQCALEVQAHGIEKDSFLRRNLARFVYKRAHVVRTVSSRLADILTLTYGVPKEKIVVVPIYVDVSRLGFDTEELSVKVDAFRNTCNNTYNICMVGRLVSVKNIGLALRAVLRLSKTYLDIHLHIVGEGGLRSSLERLVDTLGIRDFVTFHGQKAGTELGAIYSCCDSFIHTADSEGYGMVLIEALHAGLPIVTTDVGCVRSVVIDNQNALVVPPRDVEALVRGLTRLREDSALRDALKVATKNSVLSLPAYSAVIARYKAVWETAVAVYTKSG